MRRRLGPPTHGLAASGPGSGSRRGGCRLFRRSAALLLVIVVATACGNGDVAVEQADIVPHPGGEQVVLQVKTTGRPAAPESYFTDVPSLTVLGNGRMITEGVQVAVFPPPILPPLLERKATERGLQQLLGAAGAAGLLSPGLEYGRPEIAEASTTVIQVQAEGQAFTREIYALTETTSAAALTEQQQELRHRLTDFLQSVRTPETGLVAPSQLSEPRPFDAEAFAIRTQAVPAGSDPVPSADLEPQILQWPLTEVDPDAARSCLVVRGARAERLAEAAVRITTLTRFRWNDMTYSLKVRPLLPNEEHCDAVRLRN